MSKAAVLLVSYHFYPSSEVGAKRPSETALHLHRSRFNVTVLRGCAPADRRRGLPPAFDELRMITVTISRRFITELWLALKALRARARRAAPAVDNGSSANDSDRERHGAIAWLRRQIVAFEGFLQNDKRWLCKSVVRLLLLRGRRFDLVVASGPPMAGYVCGMIAARLFRAPLVLDFRDPWYLHGDPERKSAAPGHALGRLENRLAQYCVAHSARIVVASPGIERHLRESFALGSQRIDLVRNGFDDYTVVSEPAPTGRLAMLYAGTLYWNRNPFPFLRALAQVCAEPAVSRDRIGLLLVGRCFEWGGTALEPWLAQHGIADVVRVLPTVASAELTKLVAASNVLINFAQGQPRQIPAKSYEYIASGREVLTIAETSSDVADLFREAGVGTILEPEDSDGMARSIRRLYDWFVAQGRPVDVKGNAAGFSRSSQLVKFEKTIDDTLLSVS